MPPDYAKLIFNMSDDELERFTADWVASKMSVYGGGHERFSGSGDMGRDVVGYCSARRLDGDWHNYQCKQLKRTLGVGEFLLEIGKIFFHSLGGAFPLPQKMHFVAPRGAVRAVGAYASRPSTLGPALIDAWDKYCASRIEENMHHPLTPDLRRAIDGYDFANLVILDADKLVRFPEVLSVLVKWFDVDPGDYTRNGAPADPIEEEATYISELLAAYGEDGGAVMSSPTDALANPNYGRHLKDQRTRYFEASDFKRYYRDNTPPGTVEDFQEQVYHGVVDESRGTFSSSLERVDKVLKQAVAVATVGRLGKYARPAVKQGTCHHLVNAGELRWRP